MPQLDKLSFVPQLLYFFIVFFVLFLFLSKVVLPAIGLSLKLRESVGDATGKKLTNILTSADVFEEYKDSLKIFSTQVATEINATESKFVLMQAVTEVTLDKGKAISQIKEVSLKEIKLSYLRVLSV